MANDETKSGAMVPVGEPTTGPSANEQMVKWGFGIGKSQYLTTLDESTPEGRIKVFKLLQCNGDNLDNYFNNVVKVSHFLISPVDIADKASGEVRRLPLTRMLLDDGVTILQTTGKVVADVLLLYSEKVRPAPWNPPAEFIPRKQKTRDGGQFYTLEPTFADIAPASGTQPAKGKGR